VCCGVLGELLLFLVTAFQTSGEEIGGVGTDFATEKIERITEPEVDVLLNDVERDATQFANVALFHQLCSAPDHAAETRVADKHVVRFFSKHEAAGAREWFET